MRIGADSSRILMKMLLCIVVCISVWIYRPLEARAWDADIDSNGNIIIHTVDKEKTSKVFYRTIGVTITRCKYDPASKSIHKDKDWIRADLVNKVEKKNNGYISVDWTISFSDIYNAVMVRNPAWAKELKDAKDGTGLAAYVKIDCVMEVIDDNKKEKYGPFMNAPGKFGGDGNEKTGINEAGETIQSFRGWANPKGLETHYNHYRLFGKGKKTTKSISDTFVLHDATKDHYNAAGVSEVPAFAMKNTAHNNKFDLSKGIPTKEAIDNSYFADSWYGSIDVYAKVVSHDYGDHSVKYTWNEEVEYTHTYYTDDDNDGIKETKHEEKKTKTVEKSKTLTYHIGEVWMAYEYIANASIYDFEDATIRNGVYPGESLYYSDSGKVTIDYCSTPKNYANQSSAAIIDWTSDKDKHVTFATFSCKTEDDKVGSSDAADKDFEKVKAYIRDQIEKGCKSQNDRFVIAGKVYLSDAVVTGCNFSDDALTYTECTNSAAMKHKYGESNKLESTDPTDVTGNQIDLYIPETVDNGPHRTSMKVYYGRMFPNDQAPEVFSASETDIDPDHVIDGYEDNEPIVVHTPVTASITIQEKNKSVVEKDVQLITKEPGAVQLRLDKEYNLHWDMIDHNNILGYGTANAGGINKYDKYVKDKWIKCPFEVYYDGKFYAPNKWIQIKRPAKWDDPALINHWIDTPIYIPSYAEEVKGDNVKIEYKVEAVNVDGELGNHDGAEEDDKNTNLDKYVSKAAKKVQVSGYVYDFTITGSNNAEIYDGSNMVGSNIIAFADQKAEKKAGKRNRIGDSNVRYLADGELNNLWESENTLVLTDGKSKQYKKMGALWKGQTISFTIKTMSNLTNANDSIEIIPKFTYIDKAGNRKTNIKVFYNNEKGSGLFIEAGSERDLMARNQMKTSIGDPMQSGAYYTKSMQNIHATDKPFGNWIGYTASLTGRKESDILNKQIESYCLGKITLTPALRLYSGEYEQLRRNSQKSGNNVETYKDDMPTWTKTDDFRKSMQTWYGQYYIPNDLMVVDMDKYNSDPSTKKPFNIIDHLDTTDKVFERDGYLMINFDIIVNKNGTKYLKYKSTQDMWGVEGFEQSPFGNDPLKAKGYTYESGDVMVVDMSRSVKDKYGAGIHKIN